MPKRTKKIQLARVKMSCVQWKGASVSRRQTLVKYVGKLRRKPFVAGLLKSLLYSQFKVTPASNYGKEKEDEAINQFSEKTGLSVVKCELFVDNTKSFLSASPDELINEDSTILGSFLG